MAIHAVAKCIVNNELLSYIVSGLQQQLIFLLNLYIYIFQIVFQPVKLSRTVTCRIDWSVWFVFFSSH